MGTFPQFKTGQRRLSATDMQFQSDTVKKLEDTAYGDGVHRQSDGLSATISIDAPQVDGGPAQIGFGALVEGLDGDRLVMREVASDGSGGVVWKGPTRFNARKGFGVQDDAFDDAVVSDAAEPPEDAALLGPDTKTFMFMRRAHDEPLVYPFTSESQLADFRITAVSDESVTGVAIGVEVPPEQEPQEVRIERSRGSRNPRAGHSEGGINYTWAGPNERTAVRPSDGITEDQVLIPKYVVGQEITAKTRIVGTPEEVIWTEENERGRAWAQVQRDVES